MTTTVTTDRDETRAPARLAILIVCAVAAVWVVGALWLTIPRAGVCWSVLPAPAGCGLEPRLPVTIAACVLVLGLGAFTAWALRRLADSRWRWLLVAGFTVIVAVGYYAVLYAQ